MDKEEKGLLESYERGEWRSVNGLAAKKKKYSAYARTTLKKDKRLNIRISSHDLDGVQRAAVRDGIPYQTLISSIIHKFVVSH